VGVWLADLPCRSSFASIPIPIDPDPDSRSCLAETCGGLRNNWDCNIGGSPRFGEVILTVTTNRVCHWEGCDETTSFMSIYTGSPPDHRLATGLGWRRPAGARSQHPLFAVSCAAIATGVGADREDARGGTFAARSGVGAVGWCTAWGADADHMKTRPTQWRCRSRVHHVHADPWILWTVRRTDGQAELESAWMGCCGIGFESGRPLKIAISGSPGIGVGVVMRLWTAGSFRWP
jgi:hypothetical protein